MKTIEVERVVLVGFKLHERGELQRQLSAFCPVLKKLPGEAWVIYPRLTVNSRPTDLLVMPSHGVERVISFVDALIGAGGIILHDHDASGTSLQLLCWGEPQQMIADGMAWDGARTFRDGTFKVKQD